MSNKRIRKKRRKKALNLWLKNTAAALHSFLTPESRPWFTLNISDEDRRNYVNNKSRNSRK